MIPGLLTAGEIEKLWIKKGNVLVNVDLEQQFYHYKV